MINGVDCSSLHEAVAYALSCVGLGPQTEAKARGGNSNCTLSQVVFFEFNLPYSYFQLSGNPACSFFFCWAICFCSGKDIKYLNIIMCIHCLLIQHTCIIRLDMLVNSVYWLLTAVWFTLHMVVHFLSQSVCICRTGPYSHCISSWACSVCSRLKLHSRCEPSIYIAMCAWCIRCASVAWFSLRGCPRDSTYYVVTAWDPILHVGIIWTSYCVQ